MSEIKQADWITINASNENKIDKDTVERLTSRRKAQYQIRGGAQVVVHARIVGGAALVAHVQHNLGEPVVRLGHAAGEGRGGRRR